MGRLVARHTPVAIVMDDFYNALADNRRAPFPATTSTGHSGYSTKLP